jgi:DNA-binding XRE family transcriptional regulator
MNKSKANDFDRQALLLAGLKRVWLGEWQSGDLLRYLRKEVLGLTQQAYADLVGISRRSLSDLENNRGQANQQLLDQVFKPLGLKLGLMPRTQADLFAMMADLTQP